MALPSIGGGRQLGDGNFNETVLSVQAPPQTATSTATLTAAQITGGILVGDTTTTAATYTLPTVALLEAQMVNAKVNSAFDLSIVNIGASTGTITVAVGTGWTIVGLATVTFTTSATYRARKTGAGTWTLYRLT
jgi:hypothetical protein